MLPGLFPSAPRPAWQRGAGLPTVDRRAVPRGLASWTLAHGRYGYDLLRNNALATPNYPGALASVSAVGWALPVANFVMWTPSGAPAPTGQTAHTLEAVVYIGQGAFAFTSSLVHRSNWFGIYLTTAGTFQAYAYDSATRTVTGATVAQAGRVYVVHATIQNRVLRLYVDGVEEGSAYSLSGDPLFTTAFTISNGNQQATPVNMIAGGYAINSAWTAGECLARARAPWSFLAWPDDWAFDALGRGATIASVTLTGIAATTSAGSVAYGLGTDATGSGATGSAGSVGPAIGTSASGSAAAAAAGTPTSAIGLAVTGAAMTVSAGALAYTIGFILTGAASTASGGTLAADNGAVTRSLTGIQMSAVPGNVRVTGGTRWVPQEARAVTLPTAVGNTLPPPPRLTGDAQADIRAQGQWLATLYDQMVKVNNVFGRINDHETRIAALEATNDNGN